MKSLLLSTCLLFTFSPLPSWAGGAGTTSLDFLKIGVGARQIGMGGAAVAVADDLNGSYYNPAALGQLGRQEASLMYTDWLENITYQYAAYANPTLNWGTFAGSLHYLSWGSIQGYDALGQKSSSFGLYDWAGSLGWGKELGKGITAGANVKYLQETLETVTGSAPALDLGVLYRPQQGEYLPHFGFGAALRNLGPSVHFIQENDPLPMSLDVGTSYRAMSDALTFALDLHKYVDSNPSVSLGGEYWLKEVLAVRLGYQTGESISDGFNAGMGLKINDLQFDYAMTRFGSFGYTHRVGISYRFEGISRSLYDEGMRNMRLGRYEEAILNFDKVLMLKPDDRQALIQLKACHDKLLEEQKEMPHP